MLIFLEKALPAELVDYVIDELSDDRAGLFACSVLSRIWRPRALAHLFCSIQIIQRDVAYTYSAYEGALNIYPVEFEDMRTSAPHLLLHLRHLAIEIAANEPRADEVMQFARTVSLPSPMSVKTLRLIGLGDVDWDGVFDNFPTRFPSLHRLELDTQCLLTLDELSKAASTAREIGFLLPRPREGLTIVSDSHLAPAVPIAMPNLWSLEIVITDTEFEATFAYLPISAPALPICAAWGKIQELTLLTALGCQLYQDDLDLALAHCPNLRVLEIQLKSPRLRVPLPTSAVRLEALRYVYYGVSVSNDGVVISCESRELEDLTLASNSLALVSFTFFIAEDEMLGWDIRTARLMKRLLPSLWGSGKLTWDVKHATTSGQYRGWPGYIMDWAASSFRT
ncbi:hypothetical protein AURDEDRAFT_173926 [Auricularia subglabra TFB-10046 SS5]|uniref:F-box domain-containing protein n=1 Tax=Auricularia subglabra (strain TFB-10046 / SS5) TaxID=717982 RepID=J0WTR8_AURST|nr:hypothetical protein AURDEDRAFT_173926 [Auricularia subglabra TFB-10046 SS5]